MENHIDGIALTTQAALFIKMNFIKQNWFKVVIVILAAVFVSGYIYNIYTTNQPQNLKEKVFQELNN